MRLIRCDKFSIGVKKPEKKMRQSLFEIALFILQRPFVLLFHFPDMGRAHQKIGK